MYHVKDREHVITAEHRQIVNCAWDELNWNGETMVEMFIDGVITFKDGEFLSCRLSH